MYENVGKKKKNNEFFTLWYRGAILLAEMWGGRAEDGGCDNEMHVARFL
jgi:hypothetical protein